MRQTLEWATDVLVSESGAEQRRMLRRYPRCTIEYSGLVRGPARAYLDNLIVGRGAKKWYLPLWFDTHILDAEAAGTTLVSSSITPDALPTGDALFIQDAVPASGDLREIGAQGTGSLTLAVSVDAAQGSLFYPCRLAELTDQPSIRRLSDDLATVQSRFRLSESADSFASVDPADVGEIYRDFPVLMNLPDEGDDLEYNYERITGEIDNSVNFPYRYDKAGIGFTKQSFPWLIVGRDSYRDFMRLTYYLAGRLNPIWLPTFFSDFEATSDIAAGSTIIVRDCGFTVSGGPKINRQDIAISLVDGTTLFRRLEDSVADAGTETLTVDSAFEDPIARADILRISFMSLNRLDADQVEIEHLTDTAGVAKSILTFRSAPDIRVAGTGF